VSISLRSPRTGVRNYAGFIPSIDFPLKQRQTERDGIRKQGKEEREKLEIYEDD